jgi:hypothetical protein
LPLGPYKEISRNESKLYTQYIGKAAEHLIASELFFRGYNASIMGVDEGTDIVAVKDGKMFNFQVKAGKKYSPSNSYVFEFPISSFDRQHRDSTFYIFVLKGQNLQEKKRFLIIPYRKILHYIKLRDIKRTRGDRSYRITIHDSKSDGNLYLRKRDKRNKMTRYLDNWDFS